MKDGNGYNVRTGAPMRMIVSLIGLLSIRVSCLYSARLRVTEFSLGTYADREVCSIYCGDERSRFEAQSKEGPGCANYECSKGEIRY
jgi:hypothetical protein